MLIWVPSVLFLTYPFILMYYTLRTLHRYFCGGHTSTALDDGEGCGAKIKATIGAVKKSIFDILRESRTQYGRYVSCNSDKSSVDLKDLLLLYKYDNPVKFDM